MASYRTWFLFVVVLVTIALGKAAEDEVAATKRWSLTPVNKVSKQCPYGIYFYRACVRCICKASLTPDQLSQFTEEYFRICAGELPVPNCPKFTCATSKQHLSITPCEGKCNCNDATKITTCQRLPCPFEKGYFMKMAVDDILE